MRIKVAIDVTQALKQGWKIRKEGGDWVVLQFKYEKLGIFCFRCGIIGHTENFCAKNFEEGAAEDVAEWGPTLKADTRRNAGGKGNRWLRNGKELGQTSNNEVNQEEDVVTADEGINGVVNIDNVVRTVIVQTIRDNQLITTNTQTLPPSPPPARPRQLLMGSDTRSTRIPRYHGINSQEGLAIVPHGSAEGRIAGAAPKKRTRLAEDLQVLEDMGETHVETTIEAMKIDPMKYTEASVDAGTSKTAESDMIMNCNPLFDVNIVMAGPGNQACPEK
jgi:hypothetical protein